MKQALKLVLAIGVVCAVAYGSWSYFKPATGGNGAASMQSMSVPVSVASAVRKDMPIELRAPGTVVPTQMVSVRSRLDSQIMDVKFHDGDTVKKGDILFVLDDRSLKAQLVQMQANLARDRTQQENLQRQYDRALGLFKKGYASTTDRDNAKAAMEVATATVGADKAALENIQVQLDYAVITAPIDGRTGTISVTKGNTVKANDTQPLVTINQIQPILVQASLPQTSFDAVRQAMTAGALPVSAVREGAGETAQGTLEYIDNAIDQTTGTFATRASFANVDEHLWPGMLVTLVIRLGEDKQTLVVPEVAIQHGQSGDYVFVVADGKAHKKDVKISRTADGQAIVAEGLNDGDLVAIDGLMSIKDGSAVTIQKQS